MNLNLAFFKSKYGTVLPISKELHNREIYSDYVQLTEFVDVYIEELAKEAIVAQQIKVIDGLIEQAKQEAIEKMNGLQQRKQELLALTQE